MARVLNLQAEQELNCLDGVVSAINIVSHEKVVCVRRFTADFEQFHQVMELTMDIPAYRDWTFHWLHIALLR